MNQAHIGGVGSVQVIAGVTYTRVHARDIKVGDTVKAARVASVEVDQDATVDYRGHKRIKVVTEDTTFTGTGAFGRVTEIEVKGQTLWFLDDEAVQVA